MTNARSSCKRTRDGTENPKSVELDRVWSDATVISHFLIYTITSAAPVIYTLRRRKESPTDPFHTCSEPVCNLERRIATLTLYHTPATAVHAILALSRIRALVVHAYTHTESGAHASAPTCHLISTHVYLYTYIYIYIPRTGRRRQSVSRRDLDRENTAPHTHRGLSLSRVAVVFSSFPRAASVSGSGLESPTRCRLLLLCRARGAIIASDASSATAIYSLLCVIRLWRGREREREGLLRREDEVVRPDGVSRILPACVLCMRWREWLRFFSCSRFRRFSGEGFRSVFLEDQRRDGFLVVARILCVFWVFVFISNFSV